MTKPSALLLGKEYKKIVYWEPCRRRFFWEAGDLEQTMSDTLGRVLRAQEACVLLTYSAASVLGKGKVHGGSRGGTWWSPPGSMVSVFGCQWLTSRSARQCTAQLRDTQSDLQADPCHTGPVPARQTSAAHSTRGGKGDYTTCEALPLPNGEAWGSSHENILWEYM